MAVESNLAFIKEGKVILKAQGDLPERIIGEVKEDEETSLAYFVNRFEIIAKKVAELKQLIDTTENKGSFLVKLRHLKDQMSAFDAIGDYDALYQDLCRYELMLEDYITQNRVKNLELKKSMLQELEAAANNPNWKEATEEIKSIRNRWIRVGAVNDNQKEEVEGAFQQMTQAFFEKKRDFYLQKQEMLKVREEAYHMLIAKLKALINEPQEKWESEFATLQQDWKKLENIPKDQYEKLLAEFKKLSQPILKRLKQKPGFHTSRQQADTREVGKQQAAILAQLDQINSGEPQKSDIDTIKQLKQDWKTLGRINKVSEDVNENFYFNCDLIFDKYFLNQLSAKKAKQTDDRERLKLKLLYDLLKRDKRELETFEQNMEKFNLGTAALDKMVEVKLSKQRRKVAVKEALLKELKEISKKS